MDGYRAFNSICVGSIPTAPTSDWHDTLRTLNG